MSHKSPETKIIHEGTWTAVPNVFLDEVMAEVKPTAYLCLMVISRKTAGFHVPKARIAIRYFQLKTGIKSCDTIYAGLNELEEKGYITIEKSGSNRVAAEYGLTIPVVNVPETGALECSKNRKHKRKPKDRNVVPKKSAKSAQTNDAPAPTLTEADVWECSNGRATVPFLFPQDFMDGYERMMGRR